MDEASEKRGRLEPSADDSDEYPDRNPVDWFRNYCIVCRHFHRAVLLQEILRSIETSGREEVSAIRARIQTRTKALRGQR
jgi:hypothetical protein